MDTSKNSIDFFRHHTICARKTLYPDKTYDEVCEIVDEIINDIYKDKEQKSEGFINESELKFEDISSEEEREYIFPNGQRLYIKKPLYLSVSKSGGHRIYTEDRWCWYIQPKEGWSIRWRVREGKPSFVK